MAKRLFACWFTLALLLGFANAKPEDVYGLDYMAEQMRYDRVNFTYRWQDCGQMNAFYQYWDRTIVMCNELRATNPGIIRFIFAHEAAHAIIRQRDIPFTGLEEAAADEFATMFMLQTGRAKDVGDMAWYWRVQASPENPYDPHPSDLRRYSTLTTMLAGKAGWACCVDEWRRVVRTWNRLMGFYGPVE